MGPVSTSEVEIDATGEVVDVQALMEDPICESGIYPPEIEVLSWITCPIQKSGASFDIAKQKLEGT